MAATNKVIPIQSINGNVAPKEEGVVRVLTSIPNEGHTHVEAYCNRLWNYFHLGKLEENGRLCKQTPRFEFLLYTMGRMHTHVAREEAAKRAIENDADYLYMIDDDMICPDDMFERLYAHNVDIVAPLAFTRNFPHRPVMYSCLEGWDSVSNKDYFRNIPIENYPRNQLVRCDAVGFGAALIKMSVIKGIDAPYFQSTCGTGEDIFFCYKAGRAGFKVFMDTACSIGHLSHPQNITEAYVDDMKKSLGVDAKKAPGQYFFEEKSVTMLGE